MVASIITLVAPEAYILPIRVLDDEGRGNLFSVVRGVRLARERGVRIINMSFGTPFNISVLQTELERAEAEGIAIAAGAGNDGLEQEYFPAGSSKAFMVTALDSLDRKADFADYSPDVLVSAPGTGVRGAFPGGGWALGDGCSFAAPFLAGEIALIRAIAPTMNLETLEARVEAGVDPIYGIPGNGPYFGLLGSGRINVFKALQGLMTSSVDGVEVAGPDVAVYPNPATSEVSFVLSGARAISSVTIHDVTGRVVRRLDGPNGALASWDGLRTDGAPAGSGVYLYRVETKAQEALTGRIVLQR